jgi:hypothetical protein
MLICLNTKPIRPPNSAVPKIEFVDEDSHSPLNYLENLDTDVKGI